MSDVIDAHDLGIAGGYIIEHAMQGHIDQLQSENAKLREQIKYERQTSRARLERIDMLKAENAKLRELCTELLKMAESSDPEWLHWPEFHDELQKLGVKIVKL